MAGSTEPTSFALLIPVGDFSRLDLLGLASIILLVGHIFGGADSQITCYCLNNEYCSENGYCVSGCQPGHYGPGCQIRNIAYRRNARQSSTNIGPRNDSRPASLAVDGYYSKDMAESWAPNCSMTNSSDNHSWWQVIFDENQRYVVDNVTIISQTESEGSQLKNLYIYISNGTSTYPDGNWTLCAHQPNDVPFLSNYTCNQEKIAKSLVIEQQNELRSNLTLCEVIIGGYELHENCGPGRTGPGCLSRSCDTEICENGGGSCGPRNTCRYERCPEKDKLPPECWITIDNLETYEWWTHMTSNEIMISGWPVRKTNWRANSLVIDVSSQGVPSDYSSTTKYDLGAGGFINIFITNIQRTPPGVTYDILVTPKICLPEKLCVDEDCYDSSPCIDGVSSSVLKVAYVEEGVPPICRCKQAKMCTANGFCPNGCEPGFYGPGCLLSNVAYKKKAVQSSTYEAVRRMYSAALAVDGFYAKDGEPQYAPNCSHTNWSEHTNSWWQVFLDQTKKYVINQIIIINRLDGAASRLKNFTIFVTNDTTIYPSGSWVVCAYQKDTADFQSSYMCGPNSNIARSIAIEMWDYLTLCEVIVEASELSGDCPRGYTGPKCVLKSCDHEDCIRGGICGPLKTCKFGRCPSREQLPPDCWITFSNFTTYKWRTDSGDKRTIITGEPTSPVNFQATSVVVSVFSGARRLDYSKQFSFTISDTGRVEVSLATIPKVAYDISLSPRLCFRKKTCINENFCYDKPQCFEGGSSQPIRVAGQYNLMSDSDGNRGYDRAVNRFVMATAVVISVGALLGR